MKNINKLFAFILLAPTLMGTLVGCKDNVEIGDTDFDGLTDDIDPDPQNNQYQISLVNKDDQTETSKLTLKMDYRDFLSTGYNYNLGILGAFLVNENTDYTPKVNNNVYPVVPTRASKISPLLAQIGAIDIEKIRISDAKFDVDPYDVVNLLMGHHTFESENKKYQVYFITIIPYPTNKGWISNFDVGAANENGELTESYKLLEGSNHTDWVNHSDHKGFSVSTTRALKFIKNYQEKHQDKDATPITYVTGHSRGGAVANIIAKDFVDRNQQVRAYCFNPPNTTLVSDEVAKKDSYNSSIFNIINNGDVVSRVPAFGFKLYGKDIKLDIDEDNYENFMKKEYEGNSPETLDELEELLNKMVTKDGVTSRNNFYEIREKDEDYEEKWEGTREEMENLKKKLDNSKLFPKNSYAEKCFTYSEIKGEDPECYIEFETRPALLKALLVDFIAENDLTYINSYLDLLGRLITEILQLYMFTDFSVPAVTNEHLQPIACVMASQIK